MSQFPTEHFRRGYRITHYSYQLYIIELRSSFIHIECIDCRQEVYKLQYVDVGTQCKTYRHHF